MTGATIDRATTTAPTVLAGASSSGGHRATILGVEGLALSPDERAFLRDANPWGFILFARNVADRVVFMADGKILESGTPDEFFEHPKSDRAKDFLSKILTH